MSAREGMSVPRLQLRWEANPVADERWQWLCHYELILPLREHDVRRELYDDEGGVIGEQNELVVSIQAPTKRGSNHAPCVDINGKPFCDEPYRDGRHADWDASELGGLPVYVLAPDGTHFVKTENSATPAPAFDMEALRRELESLRGLLSEVSPWMHAAYDRPPQTPAAVSILEKLDALAAQAGKQGGGK